eukprot:5765417-Amphidinium_carterae.1
MSVVHSCRAHSSQSHHQWAGFAKAHGRALVGFKRSEANEQLGCFPECGLQGRPVVCRVKFSFTVTRMIKCVRSMVLSVHQGESGVQASHGRQSETLELLTWSLISYISVHHTVLLTWVVTTSAGLDIRTHLRTASERATFERCLRQPQRS